VRATRVFLIVLVAALVGGRGVSAENLAFSLLERYLDSLREQAGIPGMSVGVVQDHKLVWEAGLGRQNVETNAIPTGDTPYPIQNLSQTLGATVLLKKCVDESYLRVLDKVVRWVPTYSDQISTIGHLLTHATYSGSFKYDTSRFATLTDVMRQCAHGPYSHLLVHEIFEPLGMADSVPGEALGNPGAEDREVFSSTVLDRYSTILVKSAAPYRIDRGRAIRVEYVPRKLDASTGIVTSLRDLARFDVGMGTLLTAETQQMAWTRASAGGTLLPTGLGWFVQYYNGEFLVWQFGMAKDAYSSLVLKLPNRNLTLILLANSDGLSAPYALENGDVTTSVFAKTFLKFIGL
jgi:CubicO group peptidase (beta-lactamase class C family)